MGPAWAVLLCLLSTAAAAPPCVGPAVPEHTVLKNGTCLWPSQPPDHNSSRVQVVGATPGWFPAVLLRAGSISTPGHGLVVNPGFELSLKRLLMLNVTLASPNDTSVPKLLPLGLFNPPPARLHMMDVRLTVAPAIFQQYLSFFSASILAVRTKDDGGVGMHTDGISFLNVPYWSDNSTELYSITVVSGPCQIKDAVSLQQQSADDAALVMNRTPGCNVRFATNETLVPTLLQYATIVTSEPLLVRVATNVSLGTNLQSPIVFRRPVLLVGTSSVPISVDLGMVVNQLDTTAQSAQLSWQALVLENLAPGDATTSATAPPYSITVTTNVWAVYCNRSEDMCVPLNNVTLVIPSADEINYVTFMSTMFNSPSPSLRQLADFYITDLKMTQFEVAPGPNVESVKVLGLVTNSWNMWHVVLATAPVFAPKLAAPRQVFNQLQYKTGVLVQAISTCNSFESTQGFAAGRVHVWQLVNNVSIGGANCTWSKAIIATGATTLLGDGGANNAPGPTSQGYPLPAALSPTSGVGRAIAASSAARPVNTTGQPAARSPQDTSPGGIPNAEASLVGAGQNRSYTLNFQHAADLIQVPPGVNDNYFHIRNITLGQLPQASSVRQAGGLPAAARGLLQTGNASSVSMSGAEVGLFTIMLWPFNRSLSGTPLAVFDSRLLLPRPEWEMIAQQARSARNFALELAESRDLLLAGVTLVGGSVLKVNSLNGPGITGINLELLPDTDGADLQPGYYRPLAAASAGTSAVAQQQQGLSTGAQAAVGVAVGAAGLLLAAIGGFLFARRRSRRSQQQSRLGSKRYKQQGGGAPLGGVILGGGGTARQAAPEALLRVKSTKDLAAGGADGSWDNNVSLQMDQSAVLQQLAGGQQAASISGAEGAGSSRAALVGCSSISEPSPGIGPGSALSSSTSACGSTVCGAGTPQTASNAGVKGVVSPRQASETERLGQTIAQGLRNWNDAVSLQTIKLMQQRLQASSMRSLPRSGNTLVGTSSHSSTQPCNTQGTRPTSASTSTAANAVDGDASNASGGARRSGDRDHDLQLYDVIGQGSFGAVHLGSWRGKEVAVKVMHFTAHAFVPVEQQLVWPQQQQQQQQQERRRQAQRQQNSRPHMAIMEAVLSSSLHHPNVVQVYTYMLKPLTAGAGGGSKIDSNNRLPSVSGAVSGRQQGVVEGDGSSGGAVAAAAAGGGVERHEQVTGWQLQLVMEYCDQGTLRDALDRRRLPRTLQSCAVPHPMVAVALGHDIAAAMLHLHKEGIVHGDLKAGNVLLQATAGVSRGTTEQKHALLQVWMAAGCLPLTAKVADFGLALPLGPTDTHATLLARGTPTHMAPELFTSGHLSKASDVYAFGILLFEIVTGQRAYAGTSVPLLPHKVAVEGLRPSWPGGVPGALRTLATSCWEENPQKRPSFQEVLITLEAFETSTGASSTATESPAAAAAAGSARNPAPAAAAAASYATVPNPTRPLPPLPPGARIVKRAGQPLQPQQQQPQQQQHVVPQQKQQQGGRDHHQHQHQHQHQQQQHQGGHHHHQQHSHHRHVQQQGLQEGDRVTSSQNQAGGPSEVAGLLVGGEAMHGMDMGWSEVSYGRSPHIKDLD